MNIDDIKELRYRAQFARHRWFTSKSIYQKYRDFTMIPASVYRENLALCHRSALKQGCIAECGVWRGGMSAGIADTLPGRVHYLFDSFEGLPPVRYDVDGEAAIAFQRDKNHPSYHNNCTADIGFAEHAMSMSAARKYHLIRGWFKNTIPSFAPEEPIAVLRLDGDLYESTMECLTGLYQFVLLRGLIIIDDYYDWDGCSRAVHEFLAQTKSLDRLRAVGRGCYWFKQPR